MSAAQTAPASLGNSLLLQSQARPDDIILNENPARPRTHAGAGKNFAAAIDKALT